MEDPISSTGGTFFFAATPENEAGMSADSSGSRNSPGRQGVAREMPGVSTGVAGEEKRGVRSLFLPDSVHSANSFTSRIGT